MSDPAQTQFTAQFSCFTNTRVQISTPRGALSMADPAQSVEEGVDFRFEDVRSVFYELTGTFVVLYSVYLLVQKYKYCFASTKVQMLPI